MAQSQVQLRPLRREDAAIIARLLGDDQEGISWTARIPWPFTEADAHAWLDRVLTSPDAFAIEIDGEFGGSIGLHPPDNPSEPAEVGYWIGKPFRGRGAASRALGLLVETARQRGVQRLRAALFPGNEPSIRTLTRHGFQFRQESEQDFPLRGGVRKILIFELDVR